MASKEINAGYDEKINALPSFSAIVTTRVKSSRFVVHVNN
jgi:hypothetical protein